MLDMLLKQAGVDPAEIKKFAENLATFVQKMQDDMAARAAENAQIIENQAEILRLLKGQDHE